MTTDLIQRGNADLADPPAWSPWTGPKEYAPYPIYPQPSDSPDLRDWLDRDARRCAARDVGLLAVGLLAGLLLGMTF